MTTVNRTPLYELAPTNGRDADSQAFFYGYLTACALAEDLPFNANVIDIGAGISDFGSVIAAARPDIRVTCMDIRYDNPTIVAQAKRKTSPPNVSYATGDIVKVETMSLKPESFDRLFCSRLIPHIELEDKDIAMQALINMGQLLKPDGTMTLLRGFQPLWRDVFFRRPSHITITKSMLVNEPELTLHETLASVRLPGIHRWRQVMMLVHTMDNHSGGYRTCVVGRVQCAV